MILDFLIPKRASLENPDVPLTGYNLTAAQLWSGNKSDSGEVVNGTTALQNSAVWAAVDVISAAIGALPMQLHRKDGESKEIFASHPAHRVMHRRPNDLMNPSDFKVAWLVQTLIYGTGYAEIQRNNNAQPSSVTPLMSANTWQVIEGGQLFVVTNIDGSQRAIPAMDCLILRGMSKDGLLGEAIINSGKDTIGLGSALKKFSNKFFKHNARPSMILKHPGHLDEAAAKRLRESWENIHKGLDNAHRTAVLEDGLDVQTLGSTNEHAQLIEMLNWTVPDVARYFRIPPTKLQWLEQSTFENLNELERSFLIETLDPLLTKIEEESNYKLLTEREKTSGQVFFKFNPAKRLRMNFADQVDALTKATGGPFMIRNEARDIVDLNPVPEYDEPLQPNANAVPAGDSEDVEPDENDIVATASQRRLVQSTLHRMTTRIGNKAAKAARDGGNFLEFLEDDFGNRATIAAAVGDAVCVIAEIRGDDPQTETDRLTDRLLLTCRDELFKETEKRTADEFPAAVQSLTAGWVDRVPEQLTREFLEGV